MKTQIITALSIVAVLGSAGGAYAINHTMLTTASSSESVIGTAAPVLVPVAPKGNDIPAEYLARLAAAAEAAKTTPLGNDVSGTPSSAPAGSSSGGAAAASTPSPSAEDVADDDDDDADADNGDDTDEYDDESHDDEHDDEADDDD